jgi:hypothetical protein
MSREEVQINDLEPSIIGEDVTRHAIQIRGVDGNGNEGPWSTILVYESPELLPSLQSNNYVPDQSGWFLDNDGTFEVNDGFIRGTLRSANYVSGVSGWALDQNGVVEFQDGEFRGALRIGTNTFNVDSNGNMFIGGSTFNNSPFAVNTSGQIVSASLTTSMITSGTFAAVRIPNLEASKITSGTFDPVLIPNLSADKITTGTLNANNVTITGTLSAVTLNGVSGSFSGNLTASLTNANTILIDSTGFVSVGGVNGTALSNGFMWVQEVDSFSFIGIGNNSGNPEGRLDLRSIDGAKGLRFSSRNARVQADARFYLRTSDTSTNTTANTRFNTVTGQIQLMINVSSARYKKDIREAPDFYKILDIKPRIFKYRQQVDEYGDSAKDHYGLIAEELYNLDLDYFVDFGDEDDGLVEAVAYDKISVALLPIVKNLKERIERLEEQLNGN